MRAIHRLIDTVNATGGLVQFSDGSLAPVADPDWLDLADAYVAACAELRLTPQIKPASEAGYE